LSIEAANTILTGNENQADQQPIYLFTLQLNLSIANVRPPKPLSAITDQLVTPSIN